MSVTYFNPGCALSIDRPQATQRILHALCSGGQNIQLHQICCRHDPRVESGSTIINVCAGCHRRFATLYAGVSTVSLWEVLDSLEGFPSPDYGGAEMALHDPCPIRDKPQVHAAVRSLLRKMNIRVTEAEHHGSRSVCCGDDYYPHLPVHQIHAKMRQRAAQMPCEDVVVSCVSCIKAMHIGGRTPRHLVDLLFGEATPIGTWDTEAWHKQLDAYIETH